MAERPNAAGRQMVKRPLADTNGLSGDAASSKGRSRLELLYAEMVW